MSPEKHHSVSGSCEMSNSGSPGHLGKVLEFPGKHADASISGHDERS